MTSEQQTQDGAKALVLGFVLVQAELEAQLGAAWVELIFWQMLIQGESAKDGSNWYAYASNDPINNSDPTGLWSVNKDGTYTAEKGDTLSGLSSQVYGSGSKWGNLTSWSGQLSSPSALQPGMVYSPTPFRAAPAGTNETPNPAGLVVKGDTATFTNSRGDTTTTTSPATLTQFGLSISGAGAGMAWSASAGLAVYTPSFSSQSQFSLFGSLGGGQSSGLEGSVSAFMTGWHNPSGLSDINGGNFNLGASAADTLSGGYEHEWSSSGAADQFSVGLGAGVEEHSTFSYTWSTDSFSLGASSTAGDSCDN